MSVAGIDLRFTVSSHVAWKPSIEAVMVAEPGLMPVTRPFVVTHAILESEEDQVTFLTVASDGSTTVANCNVSPTSISFSG